MAGFAPLEPGDEKPLKRIFRLPTLSQNVLEWEPAKHPLNNRLTRSHRFGLGIPFAKMYRKNHPDVDVGLIPCAWGGTPISVHLKGGNVYADMLKKARFAKSKGAVIEGVLWHQGESDTVNSQRSNSYASKLDELIKNIREDLEEPDLPFVVGELPDFYGIGRSLLHRKGISIVQNVLRTLPHRIPHTACVSAVGLKSFDRQMVHFDRNSYISFGKRYAQIFELLQLPHDRVKRVKKDWLIDRSDYRAGVYHGDNSDLILSNGLVKRTFRLAPNAATIGLDNLYTGESLLRAVRPEAQVTIDGIDYDVGGLVGQPDHAYLKPEWLDRMKNDPRAMQFVKFEVGVPEARLEWKRRRHHAPDAVWPPKGVSLRMVYRLPDKPGSAKQRKLKVSVHYELYDGIPVMSKWITVHNETKKTVRLNRFVSEIVAAVESESTVDSREGDCPSALPHIHVETDYAMGSMQADNANRDAVFWEQDPQYLTQVNYARKTRCLLKVQTKNGPEQDIASGKTFESFRAFLMPLDSTDRERNGLAQRKMYRTIAPWVTENPLTMHVRRADWPSVKRGIDQCKEVGFEMVILTFGSGFNIENTEKNYLEKLKKYADYAQQQGVEIGGYSLLASRRVGGGSDVVMRPGKRPIFGNSPCLNSRWGKAYFEKLGNFFNTTGFTLLEHDGSYPGDTCASTNHEGHRGFEDSRWNQHRRITEFYKWCRSKGIYLNVPDYYYLSGSNKCAMGYRETNWSLPRAQQVIHTRQNIYDGTWEKTSSMGWMFVPLTQYHGGGAAATIEPLDLHRDHYQRMLSSNLAFGVQACYRGPRLFDTEETESLVKKWVTWFKKYRNILESDILHGRRADGRDLDWMLHVNPNLPDKGMLVVFNPLKKTVTKSIQVNLYYTGLKNIAKISTSEGIPKNYKLGRNYTIDLTVTVPAEGMSWYAIR